MEKRLARAEHDGVDSLPDVHDEWQFFQVEAARFLDEFCVLQERAEPEESGDAREREPHELRARSIEVGGLDVGLVRADPRGLVARRQDHLRVRVRLEQLRREVREPAVAERVHLCGKEHSWWTSFLFAVRNQNAASSKRLFLQKERLWCVLW